MILRIAGLVLILAYFAALAPSAVGGGDCSPCCPQTADVPCDPGMPCTALMAVDCCAASPAVPASAAQRATDAPPPLLVLAVTQLRPPTRQLARSAGADRAPARPLVSRSVVLRT